MHNQVSEAPSRSGWLALAVLVAITALAYLNSLSGPFQFDDYAGPATDPAAQGWAAWWDTLTHRIRPLLKASYVATHQLGAWLRHATLGHHLGSLLIHVAAVVAAWRLAFLLASSFGLAAGIAGRAALGCAGLLALHPLATEAVTYISGRSVALGTLFALAAAIAQMQERRALALTAFVAALLSREAFVGVPALLLMLEWTRGNAPGAAFGLTRLRLALRRTALLWAAAAIAIMAMLAHRRYGPLLELSTVIAQGRLDSPSLLLALEYFATRLFLLAPLSIDPAVQPEHFGVLHRVVVSFAVAAVLALAWRHRAGRPWWILGLGWAIAILAPMYLVPLRHDGVSERHFYPALWGVGFALSCELGVRLRPALAIATGCAAALALSAATVMRNADYSSEVALWDAASRVPHAGPRAFNNLGVAYLGEGRWDAARAAFERALVLDGGYTKARANLDRADAGQRTGDPFAEPEI
ncbi:MAG: tetratricopeptide repeat protein [Usitatibacter sp.]